MFVCFKKFLKSFLVYFLIFAHLQQCLFAVGLVAGIGIAQADDVVLAPPPILPPVDFTPKGSPIAIKAPPAPIVPDAQAGGKLGVYQAPNGVSVVNINAPNGAGLSHNHFKEFGVDQRGAVLNNQALGAHHVGDHSNSLLAGQINNNPNFNGQAASLILNEVTGSNKSLLEGVTEIHGSQADYILANPNGITCRGCGFINMGKTSLTTGRPVYDDRGILQLDVDQGIVRIEGAGVSGSSMNAAQIREAQALGREISGLDVFDIISRSVKLNAAIHAQDVVLSGGRQQYDLQKREGTAKADDGGVGSGVKPRLAIDSTAFGGIYAGRITIIGTEDGVGVKAPKNMATSTGDMVLLSNGDLILKSNLAAAQGKITASAKGKLSLDKDTKLNAKDDVVLAALQDVVNKGKVSTQGALAVRSDQGKIYNAQNAVMQTKGDASLIAKLDIDNGGRVEAGGGVALSSIQKRIFTASQSVLKSGRTLSLNAMRNIENEGMLVGKTGLSLVTQKGDITNIKGSYLFSEGDIDLLADGRIVQSGKVLVGQDLRFRSLQDEIVIRDKAKLKAGRDINLQAMGDVNNRGVIEASGTIRLLSDNAGIFNMGAARIEAGQHLVAQANRQINNYGTFLAGGDLGLTSLNSKILNGKTGLVRADGDLKASAKWDIENQGVIQSQKSMRIDAGKKLLNKGSFESNQDIHLIAQGREMTNDGLIKAKDNLNIKASLLTNNQTFSAGKLLSVIAENIYNNKGGVITSSGDIYLRASGNNLENRAGGLIYAQRDIALQSPGNILNEQGSILSDQGDIVMTDLDGNRSRSFINSSGVVHAQQGDVRIRAQDFKNKQKVPYRRANQFIHNLLDQDIIRPGSTPESLIFANGNIYLDVEDGLNHTSSILATKNINITGGQFKNEGLKLYQYPAHMETKKVHVGWGWHNWQYKKKYANREFKVIDNPIFYKALSATIQAGGDITGNLVDSLKNQDKADESSIFKANTMPSNTQIGNIDVTHAQKTLADQLQDHPFQTQNLNRLEDVQVYFSKAMAGFDAMFKLADPEAKHLFVFRVPIETRNGFTNKNLFLGSDYFNKQVGFTPDAATKSLGDARFEDWYIRQQIRDKAGREFLKGYRIPANQLQEMMQAAGRAKRDLNITPGIKMTAALLAQLIEDIIWYEEEIIDGQHVMVPKVYFCQATIDDLAKNGNDAAALIAYGDMLLKAKNICNEGGSFEAENDLKMVAEEEIEVISGKTDAGRHLGAYAGGSIVYKKRIEEKQSANGSGTMADLPAKFSVGGNATFNAGGVVEHHAVEGDVAGDLTLNGQKGNHVRASARRSSYEQGGKSYYYKENELQKDVSILHVGGKFTASSLEGANIFEGTQLEADVIENTARDGTIIVDVADEFSKSLDTKSSNILGGTKKRTQSDYKNESKGAKLVDRSGQTHKSLQGDVIIKGSELESKEGRISLQAEKGAVKLLASEERESHSDSSIDRNLVMITSKQKGYDKKTYKEVSLRSALPVEIISPQMIAEIRENPHLDHSLKAQLDHLDHVKLQKVYDEIQTWDDVQKSLTPQFGIILAVIITAATAGAGSGVGMSIGIESAIMAAAIDAGVSAVAASAATQMAAGMILNNGNIGKAYEHAFSSDNLKSYAVSGVSAGVTAGVTNKLNLAPASSSAMARAQHLGVSTATRTVVQSTIGGQKFEDALKTNLKAAPIQFLAQQGAKKIGELYHGSENDIAKGLDQMNGTAPDSSEESAAPASKPIDWTTHKLMHGALGAGIAKLTKQDVASGAAGAIIGEIVAESYANSQKEQIGKDLKSGKIPMQEASAYLDDVETHTKIISELSALAAVTLAGGDGIAAQQAAENAVEHNVLPVIAAGIGIAVTIYNIYDSAHEALLASEAYRKGNIDGAIEHGLNVAMNNVPLGRFIPNSMKKAVAGFSRTQAEKLLRSKLAGKMQDAGQAVMQQVDKAFGKLGSNDFMQNVSKHSKKLENRLVKTNDMLNFRGSGTASTKPSASAARKAKPDSVVRVDSQSTKTRPKNSNPNVPSADGYAQSIQRAKDKGIDSGVHYKPGSKTQQKQQPWTIREGQEWKAKIHGQAQRTGTDGHATTSFRTAVEAAKKREVERVHLDHGMNRVLQKEGIKVKPNSRPDVTIVNKNGKVDVYEVPSKSDKRSLLLERNEKSLSQLPKEKEGRYKSSEIYTKEHQKNNLTRKDIQNADHQ